MDIFLLPKGLFLSNQVYLYIFLNYAFIKILICKVLQANHVFYTNIFTMSKLGNYYGNIIVNFDLSKKNNLNAWEITSQN